MHSPADTYVRTYVFEQVRIAACVVSSMYITSEATSSVCMYEGCQERADEENAGHTAQPSLL